MTVIEETMITNVQDLTDRLSVFRPDAKVEFLVGPGEVLVVLSIYSENCSFVDGKPTKAENDMLVCIDLGEPDDGGD